MEAAGEVKNREVPLNEYSAIRDGGAGLIDLSSRGRLRITGSEAVQFLNGLITNDMKTLNEHQWMPAVFPNVQGRIIATIRIARLGDQQGRKAPVPVFLLDTASATHEQVFKTLERFTFAGDFQVTDITGTTGQLSVQGKKSTPILAEIFGGSWVEPGDGGVSVFSWSDDEIIVLRATHSGENGFDLVVNSQTIAALSTAITAAGAVRTGEDTAEVLRIEAGISRFGRDFDENLVVSEANLDDAVSFTKGCYVGQEIIARIKYRGHVAKKITGVIFDGVVNVERGAILLSDDDKEAGRVTSVTDSPKLERTIGIALIKYQYLAPGTKVKAKSGDQEVYGKVTELPFVKVPSNAGICH